MKLPRAATVTYRMQSDGTLDASYEWSGPTARATMRRAPMSGAVVSAPAVATAPAAPLSGAVRTAQTPWPDYMSTLDPGLSQGPATVIVWSIDIEPPGPDVPADKARWSGRWTGWACDNQVCDAKLIVEKVTAEGASIIYGFASSSVQPFTAKLEATFVGNELQATLLNGSKIAYRMRGDQVNRVYRPQDDWRVCGRRPHQRPSAATLA